MQGSIAQKLDMRGGRETATQEIVLHPSVEEQARAWTQSTLTGEGIVEGVLLGVLLAAALGSWGGFLFYLHSLLQNYRVV